MTTYSPDAVCVVSAGCVLPDTVGTDTFWEKISAGIALTSVIEPSRWNKDIARPDATAEEEVSVSAMAGQVSLQTFTELKARHRLAADANRLTAYAVEALDQLFGKLKARPRAERVAMVLGLMNADKSSYAQIVHREKRRLDQTIRRIFPQMTTADLEFLDRFTLKHMRNTSYLEHGADIIENVVLTSLLKDLCLRFGVAGPAFYTDAACASSLVSIDVGVALLKNHAVDLVVAGGLESNLDLGTFVLFSRIKALSKTSCLPFDKASSGITHSEGAVVFALKRMADALRDGDAILGVIAACEGTSDGKSASLFQPTVAGQLRAYEKVHGKDNALSIDYIEAHATGTAVGDAVEAESIAGFFGLKKCHVGSVKSVYGHTKGTAGATSLLKALMMMEKGVVVPTPQVGSTFFDEKNVSLSVNKLPRPWPKSGDVRRVVVSSFGFGGSNYHLMIERPQGAVELAAEATRVRPVIVKIGSVYVSSAEEFHSDFYKIPPHSVAQIDSMQMLAVQAVERLIGQTKHRFLGVPKDKVGVIAGGSNGLEKMNELVKRIFYSTLLKSGLGDEELSPLVQEAFEYLQREFLDSIPRITEDSAPGILNNVVAGRVSNAFNFGNKNFAVDCDVASFDAARLVAYNELLLRPDQLFFVCGLDESINPEQMSIERRGLEVVALTSEEFALRHGLPIAGEAMGSRHSREAVVP
jgi:acyl transferase domain-containing protein